MADTAATRSVAFRSFNYYWRLAMTAGVAVGTTEINLNLIASRWLDLPRE